MNSLDRLTCLWLWSALGFALAVDDVVSIPRDQTSLNGSWYFGESIQPYEPTYFMLDPFRIDAKFQLSFSFRLLGQPQAVRGGSDRARGLYVSYSQTSLWNLNEESAPFYDSSYRPEVWWHQDGLPPILGMSGLDTQFGFGHESNGKSGDESRSLNKLFVRPVARWDVGHDWQLRLRPRVFGYIFDLSDNPDMADYRGNVDFDADVGQPHGWLFNAQMRVGRHADRASIQIDASYPINRITNNWVNAFGYIQLFDGWSEMLRSYDERQTRLSVGIAVSR